MSNSLTNLVGILFAVYIAVGGAMVIAGYRKVGDILVPIVVLLVALALLPGLTASTVQSFFRIISPWWFIALGVLLLIGIYLRK